VNKEYDPSCIVSYVVELIRHIKTEGPNEEDIDILEELVGHGDCVDKDVINGIIDLGLNCCTDDFEYAAFVARVSNNMINKWVANGESEVSDARFAFAVRAGLIEMCLNFIEQYWKDEKGVNGKDDTEVGDEDDPHKSGEEEEESLFSDIESILVHINSLSLHEKSAKAIRSKRCDIEEKLHQLEKNVDITRNDPGKKLLDMIRSTLNLNGLYCCRCNKSLSRTEVKQCEGCSRMTYCSRACQKEDWSNGHKLACCKSYTNKTAGQFQGRCEPEEVPSGQRAAAKMKEVETNFNMIHLKLFLDNAEDILRQAKALDLPLYDCVVRFDLCEYPPTTTVVVENYKTNFLGPKAIKGFEDTRSKKNITCDFISHIINGELDKDGDVPRLLMQRLFPHELLTTTKKEAMISKPRVESLSPSKGSAASPAAVDSLSEHKRLSNIQRNKARWFPLSYGGYF